MITPKKIIDLFPTVIKNFSKTELAYLSLTSKPEGPIRDKYAILLHEELSNSIVVVTKEYKRRDLVVLEFINSDSNKQKPAVKHVIEFKAGSAPSFGNKLDNSGPYKKGDEYIERIINDIRNRNKEGIDIGLDQFTSVFIGIEAMERISDNKLHFVKYADRHNRYFKYIEKFGNVDLGTCIKNRFKEKTAGNNSGNKAFKKLEYKAKEVKESFEIPVKLHIVAASPNPEAFNDI